MWAGWMQFAAEGGSILLYKNETNLGVYSYDSVVNLEGYVFQFISDSLSFVTSPLPDAIATTTLLS